MVDASVMRKTSSVPEILPLDRYDFGRAKICASVRWLLAKSYGSGESVPAELREPLYSDQYEQEHLKPGVARLLLSSELYCRAYSALQQGVPAAGAAGAAVPPRDHGSLLQQLTKCGLAPSEQERDVTENELRHKPIKTGAHLAVIDAMMSLAAMETVGLVKMAKEVEQLGSGTTWENSLLFWVNRLNQKLRETTEAEDALKSQPSTELQPAQPSCPTRWYWKLVPIRYRKDKVQSKQTPTFPLVSGVKDLSNGCAIAAVLHFYCPTLLRLEDVCLKDTMSVADSLYNLQLVREFCEGCLRECCPLALEDLLYAPPTLKVNIMCFVAELLRWFEVQKPDFVQPLHTLDLTDVSRLDDCISPTNGNSNSGSPSFIFKQPFLPITSPVSPGCMTEGRGWSKKQTSRPLSAVTFSIPFPLDSDVDVVMGNPLFRSISTDSLTPGGFVTAMNPAPYTPPEDLSRLIQTAPLGELPTIEEALSIIHTGPASGVRPEPRLRPEGAPDGFYLHTPEDGTARLSSSAPCRSGMLYRPAGTERRGDGKRLSRDDDSVPRDVSADSDASEDLAKTGSTPGTPGTPGSRGGRMTSFAERRKRLPESPTASRAQGAEEAVSPGTGSPAGAVEAQELGARLEEKRRAIEAQKRRIEAIFTKHRQRLGKNAFLQLRREQGEGGGGEGEGGGEGQGGGGGEEESLTLEERLTRMEEDLRKEEEKEKDEEKQKEEGGDGKAPPKLDKQVTFSVETRKGAEQGAGREPPRGEYDEAVSKLSSALLALQKDMQRLTEQQQSLMGKKTTKTTPSRKTPPPSKAWVIPTGPKASATPPRLSRESTCDLSPSGSPSRSSHVPSTPKSPSSSTPSRRARSAAAAALKSPKRQQRPVRPSELSFPPLMRVLTPPQNVDTLPHLRRVSPSQCQVQTRSSLRLGGPRTPQDPRPGPGAAASARPQESASESGSSDEHTPLFSLELEAEPEPPLLSTASLAGSAGGGSSSGAPSECSFDSDVLTSAPLTDAEGGRGGLLEMALSSLEGPLGAGEETDQEQGPEIFSSDSMSDQTESSETKGGVGFYFKGDGLTEEEMALKKAALLEKQQKRAEEIKRRRQEQERENSRPSFSDEFRALPPLSQSLPSSCPLPPPLQVTPPATPQRRAGFARAEYERRSQLRIMADLDKVLRQKPTATKSGKSGHGGRRQQQRPRSAAVTDLSAVPPSTAVKDDAAIKRSAAVPPSTAVKDDAAIKRSAAVPPSTAVKDDAAIKRSAAVPPSTAVKDDSAIKRSAAVPPSTAVKDDTAIKHSAAVPPSTAVKDDSAIKHSAAVPPSTAVKDHFAVKRSPAKGDGKGVPRQQQLQRPVIDDPSGPRRAAIRAATTAVQSDQSAVSPSPAVPGQPSVPGCTAGKDDSVFPSSAAVKGDSSRPASAAVTDHSATPRSADVKEESTVPPSPAGTDNSAVPRRAAVSNDSVSNDSAIPRSPAKGGKGILVKPETSTQTNGPLPAQKPPSRSNSPSRLMSPGLLANHNGDKDWENGSNASSPASIPEYTGPKLYREPSFKSNKFIINNALSRCCLAGKVNETQKNKIVEEMERSSANHFLILFRDSSCQFRGVYTLSPAPAGPEAESAEQLTRLCGVGPRLISPAAVETIYKYSSDRKQFSAIPSKTMSMSVDAFTIPGHLWHGRKQSTPKKAATPQIIDRATPKKAAMPK